MSRLPLRFVPLIIVAMSLAANSASAQGSINFGRGHIQIGHHHGHPVPPRYCPPPYRPPVICPPVYRPPVICPPPYRPPVVCPPTHPIVHPPHPGWPHPGHPAGGHQTNFRDPAQFFQR